MNPKPGLDLKPGLYIDSQGRRYHVTDDGRLGREDASGEYQYLPPGETLQGAAFMGQLLSRGELTPQRGMKEAFEDKGYWGNDFGLMAGYPGPDQAAQERVPPEPSLQEGRGAPGVAGGMREAFEDKGYWGLDLGLTPGFPGPGQPKPEPKPEPEPEPEPEGEAPTDRAARRALRKAKRKGGKPST